MSKPLFDVSKCIFCGCTDDMACEGGCSWYIVDDRKGKGVCSNCVGRLEKRAQRRKKSGSANARSQSKSKYSSIQRPAKRALAKTKKR